VKSPQGGVLVEMTEHGIQVVAEVAVHERVDDWVGDVVKEVDVEDESIVRDDVE